MKSLKQKTLYHELRWKYIWQRALESCCWKWAEPSLALSCQEAVPRARPVPSPPKGSPKVPAIGTPPHARFGHDGSFSTAKALQVTYEQHHCLRSDPFKKKNSWMKAARAKLFQGNW